MHDDLSGLQRTITGGVLAEGGDHRRGDGSDRRMAGPQRARDRARAAAAVGAARRRHRADAAMLSVALRELRNLA